MAKRAHRLDVEIDELTNSIKEVATGRELRTEVIRMLSIHVRQIKKSDWSFDWQHELNTPRREVYKLIARDEPDRIQGLLCVEDSGDHVFAHLLESARPNRGKAKRYAGVPGNLMAYACQLAFDKGYLGFVVFVSKSALIAHYAETLKAQVLRGNRMVLNTAAARYLVDRYFTER
jgi:hypothetical protein